MEGERETSPLAASSLPALPPRPAASLPPSFVPRGVWTEKEMLKTDNNTEGGEGETTGDRQCARRDEGRREHTTRAPGGRRRWHWWPGRPSPPWCFEKGTAATRRPSRSRGAAHSPALSSSSPPPPTRAPSPPFPLSRLSPAVACRSAGAGGGGGGDGGRGVEERAVTFRAGDNSSRSHWPAFSPSPPPLGDTATVGEGKKGKEGGAERGGRRLSSNVPKRRGERKGRD